jgi:phage gp45-like
MIRGIVQSVVEGVIKRFIASGRTGETITDREYMQHYGFTSRPLQGAEAVIIKEGNHILMIASDDRRYRIAIEDGEVCMYTDEGDYIRFLRGKTLHVNTGNKLLIDATNDVEINTATAVVNSSTKCQVNSPEINLSGDRGDLRRMVDERLLSIFNGHTHNGGSVPDQQLTTGTTCTDITRAL